MLLPRYEAFTELWYYFMPNCWEGLKKPEASSKQVLSYQKHISCLRTFTASYGLLHEAVGIF